MPSFTTRDKVNANELQLLTVVYVHYESCCLPMQKLRQIEQLKQQQSDGKELELNQVLLQLTSNLPACLLLYND